MNTPPRVKSAKNPGCGAVGVRGHNEVTGEDLSSKVNELVAPWAPLKRKNPTLVCLSSINLSEDIASADDMEELIRQFNAMSLEDDGMRRTPLLRSAKREEFEDSTSAAPESFRRELVGRMEELIHNFESMSLEDDMDDLISRFNKMSLDDDLEQIEEDYYYMDVVQDDYYQEHYTLPEDQLYGIENICKYEEEQPHPNVTIRRGNKPSTQEDYEEDKYFICLKDEYKSI